MRADLQREAQTVRNVAEAIERALQDHPAGALIEGSVWPAIESCGVGREHFDRALQVLLTGQRVRREGDRIFS